MSKKFLAKLLIFCMVFTMLPMSAFAATGEDVAVGDVTYRVALDTTAVTVEGQISCSVVTCQSENIVCFINCNRVTGASNMYERKYHGCFARKWYSSRSY